MPTPLEVHEEVQPMEVEEEREHWEGKAPLKEEENKPEPKKQITLSPYQEGKDEHLGDDLQDYDEYAGDSSPK